MDTFETDFFAIDSDHLADVTGGFDWNRMVDNANRWGDTGALVGAGAGAVAGGVAGAVGGAGVGAIPGAETGSWIGAAAGGGAGWVGGAAYDAYKQWRGK